MPNPRQREFGDFLRARRSRLTPEMMGLSLQRRRRTPGLRREEVAELAGIGVDWYIRLEQGRPVSPSPATIEALTRALKLSEMERQHLQMLAGSGLRRPFESEVAPPSLLRLLKSLKQPAYITGRRRDLLAWNEAAATLLGFNDLAKSDRNILIAMLTHPRSRALFGRRWAVEAQRMVANFRTTHDLWAGDPAFLDLLRRLRDGCPEFQQWWERHDVGNSGSGRKILRHGKQMRTFEHTSFQFNEDPAIKLVVYTPITGKSA